MSAILSGVSRSPSLSGSSPISTRISLTAVSTLIRITPLIEKFEIAARRLAQPEMDEPFTETAPEPLPQVSGDILPRRLTLGEIRDFDVEPLVVELHERVSHGPVELFGVDNHYRIGVYRACDPDLEIVIVPVPVRVRARIEYPQILLVGKPLDVEPVPGGKPVSFGDGNYFLYDRSLQ